MDVVGNSVDLLVRLMGAATVRNRVLMHNLANENTPGFKRSVVQFEEHLQRALERSPGDALAVEPRIVEDALTPARPDGNNVTQELELNALRENQLLYDAYAGILRAHFDLLHTSIATR